MNNMKYDDWWLLPLFFEKSQVNNRLRVFFFTLTGVEMNNNLRIFKEGRVIDYFWERENERS